MPHFLAQLLEELGQVSQWESSLPPCNVGIPLAHPPAGILIPVSGHRPQCLLALARREQVPSCDSECIIVSSDFTLIAFEI